MKLKTTKHYYSHLTKKKQQPKNVLFGQPNTLSIALSPVFFLSTLPAILYTYLKTAIALYLHYEMLTYLSIMKMKNLEMLPP